MMSLSHLYSAVHLLWIKENYYHHQKIPLLVLGNFQKYNVSKWLNVKNYFSGHYNRIYAFVL